MKKVIFGITSLGLGGAERILVDVANCLSEKYDVTILTIYSKGNLEKELNKKVHLKSMYNTTYEKLSKIKKILIPIHVLINKKRIYKKYVKSDYDAEIAFLEGPITRIFSTKNKEVKKIAWVHNDISKVFGNTIKAKIKKAIDKKTYTKYNTIVFVSKDNKEKFKKVYSNIKNVNLEVIRNYIDQNRIINLAEKEHESLFNNQEVNIVQVSRLVEQKAIERLINIHKKIINKKINHHIYIIGDGYLRKKLENLIQQNEIKQTFTLLGAKENPYTYMKDADFVCLFSQFEGYPMVIEEAKILNKFILVTDTSAREVLENYKDYSKIVENSEKGIEEAIEFAVKNKDIILKKNVEFYYTNSKIIDKIENVIENK